MIQIALGRLDPMSCQVLSGQQVNLLLNRNKLFVPFYICHSSDLNASFSIWTISLVAGFPLPDQIYQLIIRRYSDDNGNMDFDNYIGCLVRLDAMCSKLVFCFWFLVKSNLYGHNLIKDIHICRCFQDAWQGQ